MMSMLNQAMNPYRCPCWWPCGPCMNLEYINVNCPSVASSTSCRTTALASWAAPSYPAKKKPEWSSGYFATSVGGGPAECDCLWQLYQYCIDDPTGTKERAWVVEGDCHNVTENTTTHFGPAVVPEWTPACDYARFPFDLGFGGCCCECEVDPPIPTDCCGNDVPAALSITDGTNSTTITYNAGSQCWEGFAASFVGCENVTISFCCGELGEWNLSLTPEFEPLDAPVGGSTQCDPFESTWTIAGCDDAGYTITITE